MTQAFQFGGRSGPLAKFDFFAGCDQLVFQHHTGMSYNNIYGSLELGQKAGLDIVIDRHSKRPWNNLSMYYSPCFEGNSNLYTFIFSGASRSSGPIQIIENPEKDLLRTLGVLRSIMYHHNQKSYFHLFKNMPRIYGLSKRKKLAAYIISQVEFAPERGFLS